MLLQAPHRPHSGRRRQRNNHMVFVHLNQHTPQMFHKTQLCRQCLQR